MATAAISGQFRAAAMGFVLLGPRQEGAGETLSTVPPMMYIMSLHHWFR